MFWPVRFQLPKLSHSSCESALNLGQKQHFWDLQSCLPFPSGIVRPKWPDAGRDGWFLKRTSEESGLAIHSKRGAPQEKPRNPRSWGGGGEGDKTIQKKKLGYGSKLTPQVLTVFGSIYQGSHRHLLSRGRGGTQRNTPTCTFAR